MAKRLPPSRFVSSLSEDDELLPPPPPPPPPPPLDTVLDNSPPTAHDMKRISPPSVLRMNNRGGNGGSKNSVAFSGVMAGMGRSLASNNSGNGNENLSPNPDAIAAAAAAAASSGIHRSRQSPNVITLDAVINSQFENEAETHILAALEAEEHDQRSHGETGRSELLGEGIEGMEDYSDCSDDGNGNGEGQEQHQTQQEERDWHMRSRSSGNDSFLRKIAFQNDLPQYRPNLASPTSTASTSSPQKTIQPHHQRYLSYVTKASTVVDYGSSAQGHTPSARDDATLLAMHIQNEHAEGGDDPFLEGAASIAPKVAAAVGGDNVTPGDGNDDEDAIQSVFQNNGDNQEENEPPVATGNTITDATETTGNMNFMAQRLRSLQRRRSSLRRSATMRGSIRSTAHSVSGGSNDDNEPESSGDRLIDALNSVDSSKNRSPLSKMAFEFRELVVPKLPKFRKNASHTLLFVIFPCLAVASVLFYMLDNPMAGDSGTSISWWILFVGVRQPLMFELTRVGEVFWVEILALRSKLFNMAVGPYVSLAVIQSQGWPYIVCFWAVLDFIMLYGDYKFPKHWLFWQNKLDIFNEGNPVVGVINSDQYMRILLSAIFVGAVSSLKRLFVAIYLGRRAVAHFGSELETLMAKMILIGEVANLARDIENKRALFDGPMSPTMHEGDDEKLVRFRREVIEDNSSMEATPSPRGISRKVLDVPLPPPPPAPASSGGDSASPSPRFLQKKVLEGSSPAPNSSGSSPGTQGTGASRGTPGRERNAAAGHGHGGSPRPKGYSPPRPPMRKSSSDAPPGAAAAPEDSTANVKLMYLLSEWEEPELNVASKDKATVRDLVEFKKAASYMDDRYPFSHAFGHAKTRETCVQSSQEVYDRLMLSAPSDCAALPFSILSILAMDEDGEYMDAKIKSLIRLFRPDRLGNLSRLDFVKSVDTVYKQLRLLRASIANSAQIDYAFESIINGFFYFFLVIIAVAIVGVKIWTVFLSFNTFFLGFSFLFGAAASNYFEGLLLIFVRRPYGIGDRIATSNPKSDTNSSGSSTWFVDKVTLFTTTVRFATTNEVATYSNGSLAVLRIINANRSPKAIVSVLIKFGLETPFNKITVFRTAVENFIKARPREWIALAGFRATRVEADHGYVEYKIVAQHRESWQNVGPVLQSKADLSSFCLEATKKLKMKYESPPMPVNLSTSDNVDLSGIFQEEDETPKGELINTGAGEGKSEHRSISAEDLQEVANLFEIRKKNK